MLLVSRNKTNAEVIYIQEGIYFLYPELFSLTYIADFFQDFFSTLLLAAVQHVRTEYLLFCSNSCPSLSSFLLRGCTAGTHTWCNLWGLMNERRHNIHVQWLCIHETYCEQLKSILKPSEDVTPAVRILFFSCSCYRQYVR